MLNKRGRHTALQVPLRTAICAWPAGAEKAPLRPGYRRQFVCRLVDVPIDETVPQPSSLAAAAPQQRLPTASLPPAELPTSDGASTQGQLPGAERHVSAVVTTGATVPPRLQLLPEGCAQLQPPAPEAAELDTSTAQAAGPAGPGDASMAAAAPGLGSSAVPAEDLRVRLYDPAAATHAPAASPLGDEAPQPCPDAITGNVAAAGAAGCAIEPAALVAPRTKAAQQPATSAIQSSSAAAAAAAAAAVAGLLPRSLSLQREAAKQPANGQQLWRSQQRQRAQQLRLQQQQWDQQQQSQARATAPEQQHLLPAADLQPSLPECGPTPACSAPAAMMECLPGMAAIPSSLTPAATSAGAVAGPYALAAGMSMGSSAADTPDSRFSQLTLQSVGHSPLRQAVSQPMDAASGSLSLHLACVGHDGPLLSNSAGYTPESSPASLVQQSQLAPAGRQPDAAASLPAGTRAAPGIAQPEAASPAAQHAANSANAQQSAAAMQRCLTSDAAGAASEAGASAASGDALQDVGIGPAAVLPQATDCQQLQMSPAPVRGDGSEPGVRPMLLADGRISSGTAAAAVTLPACSEALLGRAPCSEGAMHEANDDDGAAAAACMDAAPCELSAAALAAGLPCTEPLVADFFASGRPKRTPGGNLADVRVLCCPTLQPTVAEAACCLNNCQAVLVPRQPDVIMGMSV